MTNEVFVALEWQKIPLLIQNLSIAKKRNWKKHLSMHMKPDRKYNVINNLKGWREPINQIPTIIRK